MAADLFSAALEVQASLAKRGWRFCFIVMKAFADRPLDWEDVISVARRQRGRLDWRYVYAQLEPLAELKGTPDLVTRLRRLQRDNG
ncbi:MAG: hypothetical protein HY736_15340 [Verrucomicrobia bacterium]|nr:hypothetical protein [Verrucomicrobiota bacterium]